MYKKVTILDFIKKAMAMQNTYSAAVRNGEEMTVSISTGNRKIGRVMNVSTAPIL